MKPGTDFPGPAMSADMMSMSFCWLPGSWSVKTFIKVYLSVLEMVTEDIFPDGLR